MVMVTICFRRTLVYSHDVLVTSPVLETMVDPLWRAGVKSHARMSKARTWPSARLALMLVFKTFLVHIFQNVAPSNGAKVGEPCQPTVGCS